MASQSRIRSGFIDVAGLVLALLAALIGERAGFLLRISHFLALIEDSQAMLRVFAHGPDNPNFLYMIFILAVTSGTSWVIDNVASIDDARQRLRAFSKPVRYAYTGIALLLSPLLFVVPVFTFFKIFLTAAATVLHRLFYIRAERNGVPGIPLGIASGLFGGILVGLILTDQRQSVYDCKSNILRLVSGETMPCTQIVLLGSGPFVIVEGPAKPRLIKTTDFGLEEVDRTSGHNP
jgi:hypothetical protein